MFCNAVPFIFLILKPVSIFCNVKFKSLYSSIIKLAPPVSVALYKLYEPPFVV